MTPLVFIIALIIALCLAGIAARFWAALRVQSALRASSEEKTGWKLARASLEQNAERLSTRLQEEAQRLATEQESRKRERETATQERDAKESQFREMHGQLEAARQRDASTALALDEEKQAREHLKRELEATQATSSSHREQVVELEAELKNSGEKLCLSRFALTTRTTKRVFIARNPKVARILARKLARTNEKRPSRRMPERPFLL